MRDYKKKQGTNDVAPTGADKGDKLSGKKRSAGKATGKSKSVEKKVVEKIAPKPRATPKTSTKKVAPEVQKIATPVQKVENHLVQKEPIVQV